MLVCLRYMVCFGKSKVTRCRAKNLNPSTFAFINGGAWGAGLVLDSPGGLNGYTSLAVVSGNPAVSYCDTVNGDLKFTRASDASGAAWPGVLTVDHAGLVGFYTTLKVVNGQPAISYLDYAVGQLRFIRSTGTNVPFTINWIALEP